MNANIWLILYCVANSLFMVLVIGYLIKLQKDFPYWRNNIISTIEKTKYLEYRFNELDKDFDELDGYLDFKINDLVKDINGIKNDINILKTPVQVLPSVTWTTEPPLLTCDDEISTTNITATMKGNSNELE